MTRGVNTTKLFSEKKGSRTGKSLSSYYGSTACNSGKNELHRAHFPGIFLNNYSL